MDVTEKRRRTRETAQRLFSTLQGGVGYELHAHVHAAMNVGATRAEVAEVIFQQVTYGGMPAVVEALQVLRDVLIERGEWQE